MTDDPLDLPLQAHTDQFTAELRNIVENTTGETLDQPLDQAGALLLERLRPVKGFYSDQEWCEEAIRLCRATGHAVLVFVPPGRRRGPHQSPPSGM